VTTGRTVLISGASGGVGRGIAVASGEAGWTVWVAARREAEGEAVATEVDRAGGRGRFVTCDVTDPTAVDTAVATVVEESGRIDGLVHNATSDYSSTPGALRDAPLAMIEDQIAVNLRGLYLLGRASFGQLRIAGGAVVVLTSDAAFAGKPLRPVYAMAKAAQRGIVRVLAREWGPLGVRVNCVAPLSTSPAMDRYLAEPGNQAFLLGRIPIGRLGDPAGDIGPVVRFLLSDDAKYVTGQTIMVDGGSCSIV
jgi:NAD(P)-dependent dehydrogenase (short-subunit alcohol dehydrogenase family)